MTNSNISDSMPLKVQTSTLKSVGSILSLGLPALIIALFPVFLFGIVIKSTDDLAGFLFPYAVGVVYLVSGFWVYFLKKNGKNYNRHTCIIR